MPNYKYKATGLDGKTVHGLLPAAGVAELRQRLREENLFLTECSEQETTSSVRRLNAQQLSDFCRELSALLGAGVPLMRTISVMANRDIPKKVKDVYDRLFQSLKRGNMLSEAMTELVGVFPDLLISMFRSSEESGQMDVTAARMAEHYQKSHKLAKKVKSALTYPIVLACVTVIVLLVVFLVVLPRFFEMFESMDAELPGITKFMLNLSSGLKDNWVWVLIGVLALVLVIKTVTAIPSVKRIVDKIKLKIPVAGKLLRTIYTARFARVLSSSYSSGVSIINSLSNARDTVGNAYISSQFDELIQNVRVGNSLSASIGKVDGFDNKLAASVLIGEETGKLDDMLNSMADSFDYESEMALARLTALVEPLMIVLMAIIIGIVIVSVMLPMTSLYDAIGSGL